MKILFLDIDGPMIPGVQYLVDNMCGFYRRFPDYTVAALNTICDRTGAKIVINSTHNRSFGPDVLDIIPALIAAGVKEEYFHENPHTEVPDLKRPEAIKKWLEENSVEDWMAIDDFDFLAEYEGHEHPQMVWTDPDAGLCVKHVNQVIERFGGTKVIMLF